MNLKGISPKERKKLILVWGSAFAFLLFVFAVIMPTLEKSRELDNKLRNSRKNLAEIGRMAEKYKSLSAKNPAIASGRSSGKNLTSKIEKISNLTGAKNFVKKIAAITGAGGKEEILINISGIPLSSFLEFLKAVYSSPENLIIKNASVKTGYGDRSVLDVELNISTEI